MANNVFTQAFQQHKAKSAGQEAKTKHQEDVFLATLANGKTYADEAITIVRGVLIVLTGFVIYLGFNYYLDTFREMFPEWAAVLFAVAIPVVIEGMKIKLSMLGLRSLLFGWYAETWAAVAFWTVIIGLSIGAFVWSYNISTGGIKEVAREKSEVKNELPPIEQVLSTATADIDAQIAAINASNTEASGMKTKRGKTSWAGQLIQMNNSGTLPSLQAQRAEIAKEKMLWYKGQESKVAVKVNRWTGFIQRFGGWGEWGTLICVIAIGFFELRLREVNKKGLDPQKQSFQVLTNAPASHPTNPVLEKGGIGFHWDGYGVLDKKPLPTVPQPSQSVPQSTQHNPTVLGSNQILLQLRTKLQSDIPNLLNKNGVRSTVSNRITKAFEDCLNAMDHPEFKPTRQVGAMVYGYLAETVIPSLNGVGYPYENDSRFMQKLLSVLPPA